MTPCILSLQLIFSLAAPATAVVTYVGLNMGGSSSSSMDTIHASLFSYMTPCILSFHLIFSLAAPTTAMVTFVGLNMGGSSSSSSMDTFHTSYSSHLTPCILSFQLIFSLAAPATAVVTYVGLNMGGSSSSSSSMDTFHATGIAMLFSAGTFLYVATVHVLPEIVASGSNSGGGTSGSGHSHAASGFSACDLLLLVVGSLTPLLLTVGHHH